MTFDEYQEKSRVTALYPNAGKDFVYPTLGMVGEAGEVADKVKKVIRDHGGIMSEETRTELGKELGDVLWYLTQLGTEIGISLEEIAKKNLEKLLSRKERGVISGSGDNR